MRSFMFVVLPLAMLATTGSVAAQIVRPGDVIQVSEWVQPGVDTLRVLDACSGAVKFGFTDPAWLPSDAGRYVEVAPDGSIWVSDPSSETFYRYDTNFNRLGVSGSCSTNHIRGFTFEPSGSAHAVSSGPLVHFDSNGTVSCGPSLGFEPVDAAWLPTGMIAVTDYVNPGVHIVDPVSGASVRTITGNCALTWTLYVDTLSTGEILVTDTYSQRIVAFDPAQPPGSECVWSISVAADAYIWIQGIDVDEGTGRIYTMAHRSGVYWLEQFDLASHALLSSSPIGALPPGATLAVYPGATSGGIGQPLIYCTAKINSLGCTPSIGWSGNPSASNQFQFLITASNIVDNKAGIFFYGTSGRNAFTGQCPWSGGGFLCVLPALKRTPVQMSGGTPWSCEGTFSIDFNAVIQSGVDPNLVAGATVNGQYWYRDPQAICTTGTSDAIEFGICP
jgi:hypothetical protein